MKLKTKVEEEKILAGNFDSLDEAIQNEASYHDTEESVIEVSKKGKRVKAEKVKVEKAPRERYTYVPIPEQYLPPVGTKANVMYGRGGYFCLNFTDEQTGFNLGVLPYSGHTKNSGYKDGLVLWASEKQIEIVDNVATTLVEGYFIGNGLYPVNSNDAPAAYDRASYEKTLHAKRRELLAASKPQKEKKPAKAKKVEEVKDEVLPEHLAGIELV